MSPRIRNNFATGLVCAATVVALAVAATLVAAVYVDRIPLDLPYLRVRIEALKAMGPTVVYAADGSVLAEWRNDQDRRFMALKSVPKVMRNAVISVEDRRFYQHPGVDVVGISRAALVNVLAGRIEQGGSTISQQLVKLLVADNARTLESKLRGAPVAMLLQAKVGRDGVLEAYLNAVYFGRGAYGIQNAARRFFGVDVGRLTLAQAATLAGAIRSPSTYAREESHAALQARRDDVLRLMREQGYITPAQERAARNEPLKTIELKEAPGSVAPYFVEYVRQELIARLGSDRVHAGGLRVYTTLEPKLQAQAERAARHRLPSKADPDVAVVALRHGDGSILAMVGGRDHAASPFNLATQGRRQPGSAFKPFVLVAALENGATADSVVSASPFSAPVGRGTWTVANYEGSDPGRGMTLRDATRLSVNAVFARLILSVGPRRVAETAKRMGITTPIGENPAIALGGLKRGVSPLEMAAAYGTIANGGIREQASALVEVKDMAGRRVYAPQFVPTRALRPGVATAAGRMLHEVVVSGTGRKSTIPAWSAGKTGTTQSYRDAWFVGWSGDIVTAVWVGRQKAQIPMTDVHGIRVTGGSFPAVIWRDFMLGARDRRPSGAAASTAGRVLVGICPGSMRMATSRCPKGETIYVSAAEASNMAACAYHWTTTAARQAVPARAKVAIKPWWVAAR